MDATGSSRTDDLVRTEPHRPIIIWTTDLIIFAPGSSLRYTRSPGSFLAAFAGSAFFRGGFLLISTLIGHLRVPVSPSLYHSARISRCACKVDGFETTGKPGSNLREVEVMTPGPGFQLRQQLAAVLAGDSQVAQKGRRRSRYLLRHGCPHACERAPLADGRGAHRRRSGEKRSVAAFWLTHAHQGACLRSGFPQYRQQLARLAEARGDRRGYPAHPRLGTRQDALAAFLPVLAEHRVQAGRGAGILAIPVR